ncbi:MAG: UvrD-helicase domain-containing protein [Bacteriovoracaceae bacterium]
MSKANAEQKLAIEHRGGVLLKAGAGSGKTFVLVEHIIFLTRNWMNEFKMQPQGSFEDFIRLKYSQVVMMTFTKKAAGEMNIRIADKFSQMSESEGGLWKIAQDSLPLLTVTTIDGFCRKLISQGYFPELSTETKIIFQTERLDQIRILFEGWLAGIQDQVSEDFLEILIREKRNLLNSLTNIFSDPGLRLVWKNFSIEEARPEKLGELLGKSFQLQNLEESLLYIHQLDLPIESERSPFEAIVGTFQATGLPIIDSVDKLTIYENLFNPIKRLSGQTGKKRTPAHDLAKDGLAALRSWVKDWAPIISNYQLHFENKIFPWLKLCQNLFTYIDTRLDPNQGLTFADIEYHVSLGLKNSESRKRIQKVYQYFIVDEFQDTSEIQFSIIEKLIEKDFSRLFCVGDAKQAIYGFRGGELSVFQNCASLVPQVRTLKNNYRSLPHIIEFNNSLFKAILPLGQDFQGHDRFSVHPEDQNIPDEVQHPELGSVEVISTSLEKNLEEEEKFTSDEINALEAKLIAESIERERSQNADLVCTILYRKLKPSAELIRNLIHKKIGFTAQFKIELDEEPVIGIFLLLLKRKFDSSLNSRDVYPEFMIKQFLKVLNIDDSVKLDFEKFDKDVEYWGILEAFKKFLFSLKITNENSDINLEVIEGICEICQEDSELILQQLSLGTGEKISLEFRYGSQAEKVQLMSAHASKGLEFDIVYLAGIYTNGRENADREMFGDWPGSFYWFEDLRNKEKHKSPFYLFESEVNRYKNFSESKRLFYVACTRAKKKLVWINFLNLEGSFSISGNSWIEGLKYWMNQNSKIHLNQTELKDFDFRSALTQKNSSSLPLFFYDPMGIFPKGEGDGDLAIVPELSVTRLNSLIDCPRKFYFENVLKLRPTLEKKILFESDEEDTGIKSSAERGTYVHALIAQGIEHNYVVPRSVFNDELRKPIQWALEELKLLKDKYFFIPERPIKFKFFNFMISGIPDLILIPKNEGEAEIWDFKTGQITQENLEHYWIQLKMYAYALYELEQISRLSLVRLKLCFVDCEKILSQEVSWESIQPELNDLWRGQNRPWSIKADHCSQCSYGDICPR